MDVEVEPVMGELRNREEHVIEGIKFHTGKLNGRTVVVVATGVGKVNAAVATALLIEHFRPNEVISTGTAGAIDPTLIQGDIVIGLKTAQYDLGTMDEKDIVTTRGVKSPVAGNRNPDFFPGNTRLMNLSEISEEKLKLNFKETGQNRRRPNILKGIIVSGDMFITSPVKKGMLRKEFRADAVEMEAAVAAQVCWQQGVAYLAIRGVSDMADTTAASDFSKGHRTAAHASAHLVLEIIKNMD